MATSEEARTKVDQVNRLLGALPDFSDFSNPIWSQWYYSYLLDSYVIRVADRIQHCLEKKQNSAVLGLRFGDCLISQGNKHFGKFVTLARHGQEELVKLFPKVKVSPLQYGRLERDGVSLGNGLYFEFTFRVDARVPLEPDHDLDF